MRPPRDAPVRGNFHGISVGWADIYNWYLPDHYIEVSGVPDGFYLLETIAAPAE